jgi:hypothetical protein
MDKRYTVSGGAKSMAKNSGKPEAVSRENAEHYRWGTDCDA